MSSTTSRPTAVADPAFDHLTTSFNFVEPDVKQILGIAHTKTCSITIGTKDNTYHALYRASESGTVERVANSSDNLAFAIPSLPDIFIAAATVQIINESPEKYRGFWKKSFKDVFNQFSKTTKLGDLPGDPSVSQIVLHHNGVKEINHLLFAPDGSPLLSKDDFVEIIPRYMKNIVGNDNIPYVQYSNGNVILMALLIEEMSGMPLDKILSKYVFTPLGMHRTYMNDTDLRTCENRARPHSVSSSGDCREIHTTFSYLTDTIEAASAGGWSSAGDLAIFYGALISGLEQSKIDNESASWFTSSLCKLFQQERQVPDRPLRFDKEFIDDLFKGRSGFDSESRNGYSKVGMHVNFNDPYLGLHSLNRIICPEGKFSEHVMGKREGDKELSGYYMAGSVTGSGYTVYFFPPQRVFIIILTDTTGPLDPTDIISRLYIHEIFNLTSTKNYVELSKEVFEENAGIISEFEKQERLNDTDNPGLCGTYINNYGQSLVVSDLDGTNRGNRVTMKNSSKCSDLMRLVQTEADLFKICPTETRDLSIDRYLDWKNLYFKAMRDGNGHVKSFTREGVDQTDMYIRIEIA